MRWGVAGDFRRSLAVLNLPNCWRLFSFSFIFKSFSWTLMRRLVCAFEIEMLICYAGYYTMVARLV
jgi:hypothetical protein